VVDVVAAGVDAAAALYIAHRGSDLGRNFGGVWYGLGALDGGLKMMWSCASVFDGAKDGSAFTLSSFLVRRYVAAVRRQFRHTKETASDDWSAGRRLCESNEVAIVVVVACGVANSRCSDERRFWVAE
jgi:hypothetical protein